MGKDKRVVVAEDLVDGAEEYLGSASAGDDLAEPDGPAEGEEAVCWWGLIFSKRKMDPPLCTGLRP